MLSILKEYLKLSKFIVTLSVTFTAITGYVYATHTLNTQLFFLSIGVFLLSAGASALNQLQEIQIDKKMLRTASRPLINANINSYKAKLFIISSITTGTIILTWFTSPVTTLLGIFNIIWYNGIYTPLKRKTAFAIIPGALCGVIPILMGWFAVEHTGEFSKILFISVFMFIWQIPHFWLLLIRYADEYKQAGLPTITSLFKKEKIKYILLSWILACILFTLMSLYFGFINNKILVISVFSFTVILSIFNIYQLLLSRKEINYKTLFIVLNIMQFIFMMSLVVDNLM